MCLQGNWTQLLTGVCPPAFVGALPRVGLQLTVLHLYTCAHTHTHNIPFICNLLWEAYMFWLSTVHSCKFNLIKEKWHWFHWVLYSLVRMTTVWLCTDKGVKFSLSVKLHNGHVGFECLHAFLVENDTFSEQNHSQFISHSPLECRTAPWRGSPGARCCQSCTGRAASWWTYSHLQDKSKCLNQTWTTNGPWSKLEEVRLTVCQETFQ